jgi:hypothetical protein
VDVSLAEVYQERCTDAAVFEIDYLKIAHFLQESVRQLLRVGLVQIDRRNFVRHTVEHWD